MNKDLYLNQDYRQALMEHLCIEDLSYKIANLVIGNQLKEAKMLAFDLVNSIGSLEKMQEKKKHRDQLEDIAKKLITQGILVELVVRKL